MARLTIAGEDRRIDDPQQIREYLQPLGICYEHWEVAGRIGPEATDEEILSAYAAEIERLKEQGGYVTADVINVSPDTPGLDAMLNKFNQEHTHSDDEVRFTVSGGGIFHIHREHGPVVAIQVESGDLINVPAGTRHWFDLCSDRTIRCIRLFVDPSGWTPHYVDDPIHQDHTPVCWGPEYLPPGDDRRIDPVVKP
jgi:1,2-dihydroxy-3-keto-5-methylthiopentene dioxygenase